MVFGSKLLSSFSLSTIYSFLNCLRYIQTEKSSVNVENAVNTQTGFGSPLRDSFLTLLHPSLGVDPYFGNHWARSTNQPFC